MANYLIEVPDIGEGIAEVEIVEWNIEVGGTVEEDDLLCVVMTDKATVEIPSPVDGRVEWLACAAGTMIAVGADLVKLQVEGEGNHLQGDTSDTIEKQPKANESSTGETQDNAVSTPVTTAAPDEITGQQSTPGTEPPPPITASTTETRGTAPRPEGEKPLASPAVRQRALNAGVDLRFVHGTGPANLITHEDLDALFEGRSSAVAPLPASGPIANENIEEINVIGLRRKIAAIMQDTMQRIPHFTYVEEVDVTELEKLRARLNSERREEQPKLTILPFFMKALVIAIKRFPEMNARFDDEKNIVYRYGAAHIGIATQTDNGLVVPVVRHAETLDIWQSAAEVKRLSTAARAGQAAPRELSSSTITISSLGPMGGITTTPVINSPELAIIGINKVAKRPVWQEGGFIPRDMMNLSSSFDHRIIDGWEATLFIQHLKSLLETPATLFMDN